MCGDSFSSFLQSDFDGDKQVRVLSVAFRNSQKSAAPPKSGKKKSKSSGSRRGNVGPFRGRPRDSYPEEDDYFEHSHPAPREFLFAWFFVKVSTSVAWSWCFLVFSTALLWRREVVSWMMASPECLDLKSAVGSGVFLPAWEKIIYDAFYTFGSRGRVLLRFCGTSSIWRPPEPLSDHVPLSGSLFGRNSVPAGEGGDRRNSRSPPSLFFAGVCGTQVFGLFENDSLEVNQSLFGQVPFSDGSSINLPSFFESGRRRSLPGSSRRLLSFLSIHVLGIVWGCLSGQVLPVQGSSLWAAPRSSVFTRNFRWSWRIFEDRVFVFSLFWTAVSWSRSRRFCCWIFRGFCSARLKISSFSSSGRFQNSSRLTLRLF